MTSPYLTRQRDRWTRPNAHLFVRPDWRRFVPHDQDEHPFAFYENKYRPDQPRVPAGSREGVQRTGGGGGGQGDDGGGSGSGTEDTVGVQVAGSVIPICIIGSKALFGDGTFKVTYICADGREFIVRGVG